MAKFIAQVKIKVDGAVTRVGHGTKKKGVQGTLEGGSPWFHPPDILLAAVPDVETHWLTPVFVCMWEALCKYIKAPPCPRCERSDEVSSAALLLLAEDEAKIVVMSQTLIDGSSLPRENLQQYLLVCTHSEQMKFPTAAVD